MAFKAIQLTTGAAQAALVKGSGAGQFLNVAGTLQDPLPVSIKNEDATNPMYWGGPDVSATKGQSIPAGGTVVMNLYGESEIPWLFSASGTPVASIVCGRQ